MVVSKAGLGFLKEMELEEACEYIDFLFEKDLEEKIYQRWVAGPQYQMSFQDFREALKPKIIEEDEDILEKVYGIIDEIGGDAL